MSTPIPYLPQIAVSVAFNPTNINSLTQTWTDITPYVRNFTAHRGRQHFLDRNEASTFDLRLNNRTGFFTKGSVNGTGYTLRARLPLKATASLTDTISTITVSGTTATATVTVDGLANTQTGDTIVVSGNSGSGVNGTFTITGVTAYTVSYTVASGSTGGSGGSLVLQYPVFWGTIDLVEESVTDSLNSDLRVQATDYVKHLSLRYLYAANLYQSYVTPATYSGGSTLVSDGAVNYYRFDTQSTYNGTVDDVLVYNATTAPFSGVNGSVVGAYAQNQQGVCAYDTRTCIDLTAGTGNPTASLTFSGGLGVYVIDFWILGSGIAGQQITAGLERLNPSTGSPVGTADLYVNSSGQLAWQGDSTIVPRVLNDGYWHHIAIAADGSSAVSLAVDGQWVSTSSTTNIGPAVNTVSIANFSGYVDHVVFSTYSNIATVKAQISARAAVGALLLRDSTPGDMIAQALIVAGFGSVQTSGTTAYLAPANYDVDELAYANSNFLNGNASYGLMRMQGYQSSGGNVCNTSAYDVITTACDTEVGDFFQDNVGRFNFHTRQYPYAASRVTSVYTFEDGNPSGGNYWYVPDALRLTWDDVDIWTTVKITVQNGAEQIYENTANEATQGYSTLTKSTNATSLDQALSTAQFLGYLYQSGLPRVQSLELKARTASGTHLPAMLAAYLNNRVTFKRQMPNATPIVLDMIIEAIDDEFDAEAGDWTTTFVLDPYPLRVQTQAGKYYLISDNATYGKSDTMLAI